MAAAGAETLTVAWHSITQMYADIPRQRLLGTAHYHGVPVRLAGS
jgi:hypothetical protein